MYQYACDLSLGCISDVLLERVRLIINVDCDVVNIMSVSEVSSQSRQSIITPEYLARMECWSQYSKKD